MLRDKFQDKNQAGKTWQRVQKSSCPIKEAHVDNASGSKDKTSTIKISNAANEQGLHNLCTSMQKMVDTFLCAPLQNKSKNRSTETWKRVRIHLLPCESVAYDTDFRENLVCEGDMEGMVHWHWQHNMSKMSYVKHSSIFRQSLSSLEKNCERNKSSDFCHSMRIIQEVFTRKQRKYHNLQVDGYAKYKRADRYASTCGEQNTMLARLPSQLSFVNAPQLPHRLPSPVKKYTPSRESQRVFGPIMFWLFSNTDIASCIQCQNLIRNNNSSSSNPRLKTTSPLANCPKLQKSVAPLHDHTRVTACIFTARTKTSTHNTKKHTPRHSKNPIFLDNLFPLARPSPPESYTKPRCGKVIKTRRPRSKKKQLLELSTYSVLVGKKTELEPRQFC
jgi:hypothetical protein